MQLKLRLIIRCICRLSIVVIGHLVMSVPAFAAIETVASQQATTKLIRVRLSQAQKTIRVSGFDLRVNGQVMSGSNLPIHLQMSVALSGRTGGWKFGSALTSFGRANIKITGEMLKVNEQAWPGELVLQAAGANFDLIAKVDLDDYLRGVLPSEMPLGWPMSALRAQAVASRSYVLAEAQARMNESYDVDNTIQSQVFNWQKYSRATLGEREKIDRVLNETRGEILVSKNNEPYLAYFHSDCGGVTEVAQNVWGGGRDVTAQKKSALVHDAHCAINLSSQWQQTVSLAEIQSSARGVLDDFSSISDVRVATFAPSGRAQEIALVMADNSEKYMNSQDFRQMLGYSRLRSTLFSIEHLEDGALRFSGRGFGHGVGLCQQGARFMAGAGANYREILKRYYPQAKLISL